MIFQNACLGEEVGSRGEAPCRGSRGLKATLVGFRGKAPFSNYFSLLSLPFNSNFVALGIASLRSKFGAVAELGSERKIFSGERSERKKKFIPPKPDPVAKRRGNAHINLTNIEIMTQRG